MQKKELMNAMIHLVDQKQETCMKQIQELDSTATTERAVLSIQINIYKNAKTFINFAGDADGLPAPYLQRLKNMLTVEDALRKIYE